MGYIFQTLELLTFVFSALVTFSYPWLEQISRQELLMSVCDNFNLTSYDVPYKQLDHVLVDHKHRLLYCYVPKVSKITFYTDYIYVLLLVGGLHQLEKSTDGAKRSIKCHQLS